MQASKLETTGLNEQDEVQTPSPTREPLVANSSPSALKQLETMAESIVNDMECIWSGVVKFARQIGYLERTLEILNRKKKSLEEGVSDLQELAAFIEVYWAGGIMKRNEVLSLGHGEPEVTFPYEMSEVLLQICSSQTKTDILKLIKEDRLQVAKTCDAIRRREKALANAFQKYQKRKELLELFMDEKESYIAELVKLKKDVSSMGNPGAGGV